MKLYIVHVGFYDDSIGIYELHSNLFVVAEDIHAAKKKVKEKEIFKTKKMHIDAIQQVSNIDGYEIRLVESFENGENKVFDYTTVKKLN